MKPYKDYIIVSPYTDHDFFKRYPKGEDMQLRLMCEAPSEDSLFFYPNPYPIRTALEDRMGHPVTMYSTPFDSVFDAMVAIDEWAPQDRSPTQERRYIAGLETSPYLEDR